MLDADLTTAQSLKVTIGICTSVQAKMPALAEDEQKDLTWLMTFGKELEAIGGFTADEGINDALKGALTTFYTSFRDAIDTIKTDSQTAFEAL